MQILHISCNFYKQFLSKNYLYENHIMHGSKIRSFRLLRGLSQEEMAEKLNITQSTYSRIETDEHKLTVDVLKRIAEVLDVSIGDIVSNEPIIIQNNASNQGTQIARNENFYADQKELYEKIITAKNEEIARMQIIIDGLLKK